MNDFEWLICKDAMEMLEFVGGKASRRKLRLFGATCCRQIWDRLLSAEARLAVEVIEQWAEGQASGELATIREQMSQSPLSYDAGHAAVSFASSSLNDLQAVGGAAAHAALINEGLIDPRVAAPMVALRYGSRGCSESYNRIRSWQAETMRDIFHPIRPVTIDPAWLAWNDGIVVKLAHAIYDERELPSGHLDIGRLAVLADALEDAGCTDPDILSHCRSPGPHVRGCWVVDLLLGKK